MDDGQIMMSGKADDDAPEDPEDDECVGFADVWMNSMPDAQSK